MSTLESVVPAAQTRRELWNERSLPLGPGLVRLSDGSYRGPKSVAFHVRCMGPLAFWQVKCSFDLGALSPGGERPLLLYPIPPHAAIATCRLSQKEILGAEPQVRALDRLPENSPPPAPSSGILDTFGQETLPILSLALDGYLSSYQSTELLEFTLEFSNGLPTVDGRIKLALPGRVAQTLLPQGSQASISFHVELEDADELVDEPTCTVGAMETRRDGDILHLEAKVEAATSDLEVSFRPGRTEMPVTRLRRGNGHFLFSIFPPTSIPASPQRRDLVFAVDASENVIGGLFESIREAMCGILRTLDDNDRFALVTYGRDIDGYKGGDLCEVAQVEEACRWLESVEPKGRADIQPLLASIQSLPSEPERQLCIFLLAAGHVGNEPAILKSLDFDQSDRRYYAVGLGPSVQQAFLRRLALLTRGRCEVAPDGNSVGALKRLLGQTRALLAEVTFEGQEGNDAEVDVSTLVPSRMTSLTAEGPVHCMGVGTPNSLRFRSKDETGVFFAGTVTARDTANPALEGVWAGLRVREMIDSVRLSAGARRKQLRSEAAALAEQHGILVEDTVLVLETDGEVDVQLSALPYRWKKATPQVAKVEEETAPAFDWRKGLKARDGLFKGGRMSGEGDGDGVRHGLRSRGGGEAPGKPVSKAGKPMLDRYSLGGGVSSLETEGVSEEPVSSVGEEIVNEVFPSDEREVETGVSEVTVEVNLVAEESAQTIPDSRPNEPFEPVSAVSEPTPSAAQVPPNSEVEVLASPPVVESVASAATPVVVSAPPVVLRTPEPVVTYRNDPLVEAKCRMGAYLEQSQAMESRLALAALTGLPPEVSPGGAELPRILAQAVGLLEKRGYFSAAVSVLGLIMRDNPSVEATKKMESLLITWASSLDDHHLPEAAQILQLGQRLCPLSDGLATALEELWQRWALVSEESRRLPVVSEWTNKVGPDQTIPSPGQLELLELRQKHEALTDEVASLRSSLEAKLEALPALLQKALAQGVAAAVATSTSPVSTVPKPIERAEPVPVVKPAASVPIVDPVSVLPIRQEETVASKLLAQSGTETTLPVSSVLPTDRSPSSASGSAPPGSTRSVSAEVLVAKSSDNRSEESSEVLNLTKDELLELLQAEPKDESGHRAVKTAFPDPKDRINFYRDLVRIDAEQPVHSLSLARAYKDAVQTKVAVVHYQKYLRSEKDRDVYLELAESYDELGKSNLGVSARKAAELLN